MAIDTSGRWWIGDSPGDIEEYLKALKVEGCDVDRFKLSRCSCGSELHRLDVDDDEGAAKRTCGNCGDIKFIGDSETYFGGATRTFECVECNAKTCNVGVGFSLYESGSCDVRWLSVGVRCTLCGILGCMVDWKVGGGNDADFFERV